MVSGYDLSRNFWNWAFDNPEKISPNHAAIYFFAIEHCNRLGWKEKFGFPSQMTMDAIGIKKHQTYIKYFNDLVEYGFFKLIQKSKNQYSANIISLINAMPKKGKALDKAIIKHVAKQTETNGQSIGQSKDSINKQRTKNNKTNKPRTIVYPFNSEKFLEQWQFWKDFKKEEWNFEYKSEKSEQAALKDLAKKSGNDEQKAIDIIHQSFARRWQGLFELKDNKTEYKEIGQERYEQASRIMQKIRSESD